MRWRSPKAGSMPRRFIQSSRRHADLEHREVLAPCGPPWPGAGTGRPTRPRSPRGAGRRGTARPWPARRSADSVTSSPFGGSRRWSPRRPGGPAGVGEGRLAGPVRAHQGVELAGADGQVDDRAGSRPVGRGVEVPDLEERGVRRHRLTWQVLSHGPAPSHRPCSATLPAPFRPIRRGGVARSRSWTRSPCPGSIVMSAPKRAEDALVDRTDDGREVRRVLERVLPGPPGKRVSPVKSTGEPSSAKQMIPACGPACAASGGAGARPRERCRPRASGRSGSMAASSVLTATSMPASRSCGTAWMWSQWPWVSTTWRTPRCGRARAAARARWRRRPDGARRCRQRTT